MSQKVKGIINYKNSSPYPIQLEIVFINNSHFKENIIRWRKEKDLIIKFKDEGSLVTTSVDLAFKSKGLFIILINNIFNDFNFYDERDREIIKPSRLINKGISFLMIKKN